MLDDLRYRWRALFQRDAVEEDLAEELRYHIERQAELLRARGLSEAEAMRQARVAFGGVEPAKEKCRDARGLWMLEALARDLRHALRQWRKSPAFALTAVSALAIAIAANTAVFAFVRAIVIEKLNVPGAERLVTIGRRNAAFHDDGSATAFSYGVFEELRQRDPDFEDVLAVTAIKLKLTVREQTQSTGAEIVSGNYFRMLGVRPAAGRLLDEKDDAAEKGAAVCVISSRLWQERFGSDPAIAGTRVLLDGTPFEIVGVSQQGFSGAQLHDPHDIQIPSSMVEHFFGTSRTGMGWARLLARLKPGVTRQAAVARLEVTGREIEARLGFHRTAGELYLLNDGSQGIGHTKSELARPILLLLMLVGAVLAIACANLASLLLARSVERTREAGIRLAIGASRAAVVRYFVSEGLLLAAAGGAAGWLLALWLERVLLTLLGNEGEGLAPHVRPDLLGVGFFAGITLAAAILVSVLPGWRASRADPMGAIHGAGFSGRQRPVAARLLVAAQVALSIILIFGAGLFVRTLRNLRSLDLGFQADRLVLADVDLDGTTHERNPEPFFDELLRATREMPGVRAASLTQISNLSGDMQSIVLRVPRYPSTNANPAITYFTSVSSDSFRTLGIPLLAGRDFAAGDRGQGEGAAIVNERFARQFFGGDALGRVFAYGGGRKVHVVGIVGNARFRRLREELQPIMYLPVTQWRFPRSLHLQVRTAGDGSEAMAAIRALIRGLDPKLPVGRVTTMAVQIDSSITRERLLALLSAILGGIATVLVIIGVYGVVSCSVARRIREIGIRIAIGSRRTEILALFLKEAAVTAAAGIAIGLPAAIALGRLATSLLYGLQPGDAATAMGAVAVLVLASLAAALIPAVRASRLDPVSSLRHE